jgi:hypothetical protein
VIVATGPSTDEGASPLDPTSDAAFVAWLRGLFGADGTLHVPRLVVVDDGGQECIVLQRQDYRAEVVVSLPVRPGQNRTDVSLYAHNGTPSDPDLGPALGFEIVVDGNHAYGVDVEPDRWGGWEVHPSGNDPLAPEARPR